MEIKKIDSVFFYGYIDSIDSYICYNILKENNIEIETFHNVLDEEYLKQVLKHLREDWKLPISETDTLPIIKWRIFKEEMVGMECAIGSEQLKNSNLIKNKDLITKRID